MPSARFSPAVIVTLFALAACGGGKDNPAKQDLSRDTALGRDLRTAAVDTSLTAAPDGPPTAMRTSPPAAMPNTPSCDSPARADQHACLMAHIASSDVGLNRNYQALIAELKRQAGASADGEEPSQVKVVRRAQRAWLEFRDKECLQRNRGKEGPLWAPMRAQCLAEYSKVREEQLATMLAKGAIQ